MLNKVDQNSFYQKLGENIRSVRDEKKVKQETLANHLGFTRISISNIETGKQKIQLHSLIQLSDYLQVPIENLLPSPRQVMKEINSKIERKINNTEISNNSNSLEKIKDFIRLSTSNTAK